MKKTKSASRGFTLIELLVVIAIIGILSSVVLASLNTARNKGNNAAVKSNLATVQTQAQLYYDDHANAFSTTAISACTSDMFIETTIKAAIDAAVSAGGGAAACYSDGQNYAISVPLKSAESGKNDWCVDSTGVERATASATTGTACPAS